MSGDPGHPQKKRTKTNFLSSRPIFDSDAMFLKDPDVDDALPSDANIMSVHFCECSSNNVALSRKARYVIFVSDCFAAC